MVPGPAELGREAVCCRALGGCGDPNWTFIAVVIIECPNVPASSWDTARVRATRVTGLRGRDAAPSWFSPPSSLASSPTIRRQNAVTTVANRHTPPFG